MGQEHDDYADDDRPRRRAADWRRLRQAAIPLLIVCIPVSCLFGIVAGALLEDRRMYRSTFERDRDVLAPVLAADPAFAKVKVYPNSGGGVDLEGEVATTADGQRLRAAFVRLFGETQLWRVCVIVRETGKNVPTDGDAPATR